MITLTLINKFQELLKDKNIDAFIIPTNDFHLSEYVSDYFKARAYLTGFTGSAGTLVVTKEKALLWTDGRYFIQAEKQIENTGIILMKMGNPNVDTITEYLGKIFKNGGTLAFDFRVIETSYALELESKLNNVNIVNLDLVSLIWENRPSMPFSMLYLLDNIFSGEEYNSKISRIRIEMKKQNATYHIISKLEDQAWIYNLRANDVASTPVFLSFSVITLNNVYLFIDQNT